MHREEAELRNTSKATKAKHCKLKNENQDKLLSEKRLNAIEETRKIYFRKSHNSIFSSKKSISKVFQTSLFLMFDSGVCLLCLSFNKGRELNFRLE